MQVDSAPRVGPGRPVFQVTLDVTAYGMKLRPDLVMAPGMQLYRQHMIALQAEKQSIGKARFPGVLPRTGNHEGLVFRRIPPQPVDEGVRVPGRLLRRD